ncbi:MAG: RHS repeat protein [Ilumatobacter sp.]|nr:RHS repeat protein [Ilumatobacter sp.]
MTIPAADRSRHRRSRAGVAGLVAMATVAAGCTSGDSDAAWSIRSDSVTVDAPTSCAEVGCVGDGIDTSTGDYRIATSDVVFPPGVYGIELLRSYRSGDDRIGWFGRGWSTVYETSLVVDDAHLTINAPAGFRPLWNPEAPTGWDVAGSASVTRDDGGYALRWPTGERWHFDDEGSLDSLTAPGGTSVTVEQTAEVITLTSSQGLSVTLDLDADRVVALASSDGRTAEYEYQGDLMSRVTAPGVDTRYRYDADQLLTETRTQAATTTNAYMNGKVTNQRTAAGQRLAFEYAADGTTVESTGPPVTYEHDADGRLVRVGYGETDMLLRAFDTSGRLVSETEYVYPGGEIVSSVEHSYTDGRLTETTLNGETTTYDYDEHGRVIAIDGPESITFGYDSDFALPTAVTTPAAGRTALEYSDGFIVAATDATAVAALTTRDRLGNPTGTGTSRDAMWTFEFDAEGNVTTTTSPTGRTWSTSWAPQSTLVRERDPVGRTSSYRYDNAGRLIRESRPDRGVTDRTYNDAGQLTSVTEPGELTTRYEYDPSGRVATVVLPGDRTWRASYDDHHDGSQTVTATAPDGTATVTVLDSSGREIERRSVESDGRTVETTTNRYEYDQLTETTVRRGSSNLVTVTTYDDAGNVSGVQSNIDGTIIRDDRYDYVDGQLVKARTSDDNATYAYDDAGRLVEISTPDDTWTATYRDGQIAATRHNDATTQIERDLDSRPIEFVDEFDVATIWRYDDADRPTQRTVGAATAEFEWNNADQLTTYRAPTGATWTWSYDDATKLTGATEPGGAATVYEYELGAVSRVHTDGGERDRDDRYAYDPRGLVRTAETSIGKFTYAHDAAGRIVAVDGPRDNDDETWLVDAAGQVVEVTSDDRTFTLRYTSTGQLDEVAGPDDQFIRTTWDGNHLTTVEVDDHDPLGVTVDQLGRLATVTWDDDTHIDLTWHGDESFTIAQRDTDTAYSYELTSGRLDRFEDDDAVYTATQRVDGYLDALALTSDDVDGTIEFDAAGRPATLRSADATSAITYDQSGRVSSVLTTQPGTDPEQSVVTYDDEGRHVDGDDDLVNALFDDAGSLKQSLPNALANPISAGADVATLQVALAVDGADTILRAEPDPFAQINDAIAASTPDLTSPIGVRDRLWLARQLVVAEASSLAPTVTISAGLSTRVPVVNPDNGEVVDYNPFVDAVPSGLALGVLADQAGGGRSLFDRAVDQLGDVIGGVLSFSRDAAVFVVMNPVARPIIGALAAAAASAACSPLGSIACLPLATTAVAFLLGDAASTLATTVPAIARHCPAGDAARCGLNVAYAALAVVEIAYAAPVGASLARVGRYRLATTTTRGGARSVALGNYGEARSELVTTLRGGRVVSRDTQLYCTDVCARPDLEVLRLGARLRRRGEQLTLVEAKYGPSAHFTPHQIIVYPTLRPRLVVHHWNPGMSHPLSIS